MQAAEDAAAAAVSKAVRWGFLQGRCHMAHAWGWFAVQQIAAGPFVSIWALGTETAPKGLLQLHCHSVPSGIRHLPPAPTPGILQWQRVQLQHPIPASQGSVQRHRAATKSGLPAGVPAWRAAPAGGGSLGNATWGLPARGDGGACLAAPHERAARAQGAASKHRPVTRLGGCASARAAPAPRTQRPGLGSPASLQPCLARDAAARARALHLPPPARPPAPQHHTPHTGREARPSREPRAHLPPPARSQAGRGCARRCRLYTAPARPRAANPGLEPADRTGCPRPARPRGGAAPGPGRTSPFPGLWEPRRPALREGPGVPTTRP